MAGAIQRPQAALRKRFHIAQFASPASRSGLGADGEREDVKHGWLGRLVERGKSWRKNGAFPARFRLSMSSRIRSRDEPSQFRIGNAAAFIIIFSRNVPITPSVNRKTVAEPKYVSRRVHELEDRLPRRYWPTSSLPHMGRRNDALGITKRRQGTNWTFQGYVDSSTLKIETDQN